MKTHLPSLSLAALALLFTSHPAHAQYPLQASLFPAEQQPAGTHGYSAAADDTYVVVGAPSTDIAGVQNSGVAVVYSAATGARVATLTNPSSHADDQFGYAVAVFGSRVVVGASYDDTGAFDAGAAYVYDLSGPTPTVPVATLNHPAPSVNGRFGTTVAISGTRVVVGGTSVVYSYDVGILPPAPLAVPGGGASALAMSGQRLVVGRPNTTVFGVPGAGAVYVYDFTSGIPLGTETFGAPTNLLMEHFGNAVAISGNRIVVGAAENDTGLPDSGRAYVFDLGTSPPAFVTHLNNPTPAMSDAFGTSVGISGTRVIVGTPRDNTGASDAGSAYLFDLTSAIPATAVATVGNPMPGDNESFGFAVAIAGDRAVAGAPFDKAGGSDSGAAFLYKVAGPSPVPVATLVPALNPNPEAGGAFGGAVAISGNLMVVGALFADAPGAPNAGAAYVYDLASNTPRVPIVTLKNPSPNADDAFGVAVAIDGNRVVVGAYSDNTTGIGSGRAYVFDLSSSTPTVPSVTLANPIPTGADQFGVSVAIRGNLVAVGAQLVDLPGAVDAGRAYVFDLASPTPTIPRSSLVSPVPGFNHVFGVSVAIDGNRVIVGEPFAMIDGVAYAGAAHVFDLSVPNTTIFVTTLRKALPVLLDHFGISVALSGNRVVVGANGDDTGTTDGGAAYVFDLSGTPPFVPVFTLTSPSPGALDEFGRSVSISGMKAAVGADRDGGVSEPGLAYVFDLGGPTPTVPVVLSNPKPDPGVQFGFDIDISGSRVVVSTPGDDTLADSAGAAYVFGGAVGPPKIVIEQPEGDVIGDGSVVLFGVVVRGQTSTRTFTIRNAGVSELSLLGATIDGPFASEYSITSSPLPATLAPSASTTFDVTFAPVTAPGGVQITAVLHLSSNDADENPFDITLSASARTRLQGWRFTYFGTYDSVGNAADDFDFDGDGLVNLLEFATHRDPTVPTILPVGSFSLLFLPPMPPAFQAQALMSFTYRRSKAAVLDGLIFNVEYTEDLAGPWSLFSAPDEPLSDDGTEQERRVTLTFQSPPQVLPTKFFMRLRVSRP